MYFKSKITGEVRHFEDGINVSNYIDLTEYSHLSKAEIDKLENPEKYMNDEEKELLRLSQFRPLTRRQFKLALLENGLLDTVEQIIESIEDPITKTRIQIEYSESERFERINDSVKYMLGVLDLTSDKVDEMWLQALNF